MLPCFIGVFLNWRDSDFFSKGLQIVIPLIQLFDEILFILTIFFIYVENLSSLIYGLDSLILGLSRKKLVDGNVL